MAVDHARYEHLYAQVTAYDTHFSSVRTAATTFLASVGIVSSLGAIDHDHDIEGWFIAAFFLVLGYCMNTNFAVLSAKCHELQTGIENELCKETPDQDITKYQLRHSLKKNTVLEQQFSWWHLDMHSKLYLCGSIIYLVAVAMYCFA